MVETHRKEFTKSFRSKLDFVKFTKSLSSNLMPFMSLWFKVWKTDGWAEIKQIYYCYVKCFFRTNNFINDRHTCIAIRI
jgi:hypothetical protein